jgi:general secretion pathway protein M
MTQLPEGPAGRALAWAILAMLLAAGWVGIASPLLDAHADRAEAIARKRQIAQRMAQRAAELPALRSALGAQPVGVVGSGLVDAGSDALAGAALQATLQDIASNAGVRLVSVEVMPAEAEGAYRRLGLRVAASAPWPEMIRLLQAIERARPVMLVDALSLRAPPAQLASGDTILPIEAAFSLRAFRQDGRGG